MRLLLFVGFGLILAAAGCDGCLEPEKPKLPERARDAPRLRVPPHPELPKRSKEPFACPEGSKYVVDKKDRYSRACRNKKGKKHGRSDSWEGGAFRTEHFENGVADGPSTVYWRGGSEVTRGQYGEGREVGKWERWSGGGAGDYRVSTWDGDVEHSRSYEKETGYLGGRGTRAHTFGDVSGALERAYSRTSKSTGTSETFYKGWLCSRTEYDDDGDSIKKEHWECPLNMNGRMKKHKETPADLAP